MKNIIASSAVPPVMPSTQCVVHATPPAESRHIQSQYEYVVQDSSDACRCEPPSKASLSHFTLPCCVATTEDPERPEGETAVCRSANVRSLEQDRWVPLSRSERLSTFTHHAVLLFFDTAGVHRPIVDRPGDRDGCLLEGTGIRE